MPMPCVSSYRASCPRLLGYEQVQCSKSFGAFGKGFMLIAPSNGLTQGRFGALFRVDYAIKWINAGLIWCPVSC
eukprot:scaffold12209_cov21-Tisochrysis_lutea.AAC.1